MRVTKEMRKLVRNVVNRKVTSHEIRAATKEWDQYPIHILQRLPVEDSILIVLTLRTRLFFPVETI